LTLNLGLKFKVKQQNETKNFMTPIISGVYWGDLRTEAKHLKSGNVVTTDAPTDNNGKGEAFSPTDLVCASLGSCMMTLMGILAQRENISLQGMQWDIVKIMASNPRKVAEIHITFTHPNLLATDDQKLKLQRAALTCPVALSLNESVKQEVTFNF
jgi:putative redox protein